jgi:hypothetical protein
VCALQELGLSMPQFIDLCIMCGCDYASNIRGIGAVRALNLIKQHGSVEAAVAVSRLHGRRAGLPGCNAWGTRAHHHAAMPNDLSVMDHGVVLHMHAYVLGV